MAVYDLDTTSTTTLINSLSAALTSASVLTTEHRKTTTMLIVTTTKSDRVWRVNAAAESGLIIKGYYGTGWTSGDTTTAEKNLVVPAGYGVYVNAAALIVTTDALILAYKDTTFTWGQAFLRANNTASTRLAIGWTFGATVTTNAWDTDAGAAIFLATLRAQTTIISSGGNYYDLPMPVLTAGNVLLAGSVKGVSALARPSVATAHYSVYGDDVAINGGFITSPGAGAIGTSLLVEDGNL
jgi:hypothetical protein